MAVTPQQRKIFEYITEYANAKVALSWAGGAPSAIVAQERKLKAKAKMFNLKLKIVEMLEQWK